jgi:transcription elongation GreA/GreB family factor
MAAAQLLEMVKAGDIAGFETRCLEALTAGDVRLDELIPPFRQLESANQGSRVATLGQMVLENTDASSDPKAALEIARIALLADPNNATLRSRVSQLYTSVYGATQGFAGLLDASGLDSGRPARNAVRLLELCLTLKPGDMLISRTEDTCVEMLEVDLPAGLFTIRRDGRPRNLAAADLSREYERIDPNDFRALRQLRPEKLADLVKTDPVTIVVGLLRAHDGMIDQDTLKNELVPRLISNAEWAKWWTSARAHLKKSPNVTIEGRAPVILKYSAMARTLEDDTWDAFNAVSDPHKWLSIVETYLRDKKKEKASPDAAFLKRCHTHLMEYINKIRSRRPGEALETSLVTERLDQESGQSDAEARALAVEMLRTGDPVALLRQIEDAALWDLALSALEAARPDEAAARAIELLPHAPAGLFERIVGMARKTGLLPKVQEHVDIALNDLVNHPETVYWLWKSGGAVDGLNLPPVSEIFTRVLQTLSSLGRTLHPPADRTREFRHKMKAALSLKDFALVKQCMAQVAADRAITLKTQLSRLEGLGDNTPAKLLDLLRDVHPLLWKVTEARPQPWEEANVLWTTKAGLHRKTEERDHLVNVTMRENAKRIGEAAQLGDLSENSEYKFALEERDMLRARLALMNNELSVAQVIEALDVPTDYAGIGSKATLKNLETGEVKSLTFVGPFEGDIELGLYNYKAPVCQKLMGLHIGERARVALDGHEREWEVVAITNGLA